MNATLIRCCTLYCLSLTLLAASTAFAAELPKRKSGLWETTMQMAGMPNMGPMQQCVDQATDNIMQQRAASQKQDCSVIEVKPQGSKVSIYSVCKVDGTTATSNGVFTGSFDSSYKGEISTRFSPPMQGMSETKVSIESTWKGACKPGQTPGQMIMPKLDMEALMKDPKMMELMKQQK